MKPDLQLANYLASYLPPIPPAGYTAGTCTRPIDDYTACELAIDVCYAPTNNISSRIVLTTRDYEWHAATPNVPPLTYIVPGGQCLAKSVAAGIPSDATAGTCVGDLAHGDSCTTADRLPPYVATCTDGVLSWTDPPASCNFTEIAARLAGFVPCTCPSSLAHGETCTFELEDGYTSINSRNVTCYQGVPQPMIAIMHDCPANSFDVSILPAGIGPGNCLDAFAFGEYCILELLSGYHLTAATQLLRVCSGGAIYTSGSVTVVADVSGASCNTSDLSGPNTAFDQDWSGTCGTTSGSTCDIVLNSGWWTFVTSNATLTCLDGGYQGFPTYLGMCATSYTAMQWPAIGSGNCSDYLAMGESCTFGPVNDLYELTPGVSLTATCLPLGTGNAYPTPMTPTFTGGSGIINPIQINPALTQSFSTTLRPGNCVTPNYDATDTAFSIFMGSGTLFRFDTSACGIALANGSSCDVALGTGYPGIYIAGFSPSATMTCTHGVLSDPLPMPYSKSGCIVVPTNAFSFVNCTILTTVAEGTICELSIKSGYQLLDGWSLTSQCLGSGFLHFPQASQPGSGNMCQWNKPATRGLYVADTAADVCKWSDIYGWISSGSACQLYLRENWTLRDGVNLTVACTDGVLSSFPLATDVFAPCDVVAPIGCTMGTCTEVLKHNQSCSLDCVSGVVDGPTTRTCVNGGFSESGCNHRLACYGSDLLSAPDHFTLGTCSSTIQSIDTSCQFEVASGYELSIGSLMRTCYADGTITPSPIAQVIGSNICASGSLTLPTGLQFGSTAATSCDRDAITGATCVLVVSSGYALQTGSTQLTCLASGDWSTLPTVALALNECKSRTSECVAGYFVLPIGLEFGSASATSSCNRTATSGSICELQLASGYLLRSGSTTLTCNVNGTWSTESPPIAISTACMTQSVSLTVKPRYVTRATPVELSFNLGSRSASCPDIGANAELDSQWIIHDVNQSVGTAEAIECRSSGSTCTIPSGILVRGSTYATTLRVRLMKSIAVDVSSGVASDLQVTLTTQTGFVVQPSKLRVGIVAPTDAINVAEEVTLDAVSTSDDPDTFNADLSFSWQCLRAALDSASGSIRSSPCDLPTAAAAALTSSDALAGRLTFPANSLVAGVQYHLTVRALANDGTERTAQYQTILSTLPESASS